jgi:hypothetical protein
MESLQWSDAEHFGRRQRPLHEHQIRVGWRVGICDLYIRDHLRKHSRSVVFGYAQNHKMGRRRLMKEAATTILMLKPAIDSFRVAKGDEKNPNMLFDAEIELTMSRITETVFESVPSVSLPVSG